MNTLPTSTDVVIVGAGPTGLTLAATLAGRGIDVVLLDRQAEGANTSRAAVVHARTLEVLEEVGATETMVAEGVRSTRLVARDRDRELFGTRFDRLPTRYPYALMLSQARTEAILLDRLHALGGRVFRPYTVTDVSQDAERVTVTVADENGDRHAITARYVVGADGMHSAVREHAGIGFTGGTYGESFLLADVEMDWSLPTDEVTLFFAAAGMVVVAPLPGGTYRFVATVDEAPEHPTVADVQALLDQRGPLRRPAVVREVRWGSRFRVHHRVADTYRAGRVLLAGDAAHVHSPAGGQGMNTGIQDAVALGHALDAAMTGGGDGPLDEYTRTRRPVAEQVVAVADRLTRLATVPPRIRPLRNAAMRLAGHLPPVRRKLTWRLSGLDYR
ncbi:FAD-dependent oxidoreductase [Solihabitans fulvus]|uniref:FAD-dependent oxidoreductase n=1 Tax=Solihabitans fulvus TaxID=1892852 RepID=A0A5B2WTA4_9PSEU|nr:FAD-dependent oxidoreductase [Solihabitans fulvus]KAA2254064.1 FAD-dependent oxidoreductase [Solihabitans fulvus]